MNGWAETVVGRAGEKLGQVPSEGDTCPECKRTFLAGESAYHVTERPDDVYICFRHEAG